MVNLSDIIEEFILQMFQNNEECSDEYNNANEESVELKRNLLAQKFECSPSQINYVLKTRFNNQRGYFIESRRGGGGYIKIIRGSFEKRSVKDYIFDNIADSMTCSSANDLIEYLFEEDLLSYREAMIMKVAVSNRALISVETSSRNTVRSDILKETIALID